MQEGHTGIALFMTLSGFNFWALCLDREIHFDNFLRNRLLGIEPLIMFPMLLYSCNSDIDVGNFLPYLPY
jgi:peptidoglycan/LPS O-acetylase OafA/YrhL